MLSGCPIDTLHQQSIGRNPDLNDGERTKIRPSIKADILRKTADIKWTKPTATSRSESGTKAHGSERRSVPGGSRERRSSHEQG